MSTFGNTELPLETLDHILDFLHDDVAALRASALVQRSWVAGTRHHLFNEEIVCQGRGPRREALDNATMFVEICQSPLCSILSAIQVVIIMIADPSLDEAVVDVLNAAPNLRKVIYFDLQPGGESTKWLAGNLTQVEDIVYSPLNNHFGEDTATMIATFKGVRKLAVYASDPVHPEYPCKPAVSLTFSNLRHLRIAIWDPEGCFSGCLVASPPFIWGVWSYKHSPNTIAGGGRSNTSMPSSHPSRQLLPSVDPEVVDLEPLSQLSDLTLRAHDLRAIRASLRTVSNQSLRQLRVEQMMWPFGQLCDCNEVEELRDLGEVMRCGTLSKAILQFGYRLGANLQALNTFEKHTETGSVEVFAAEVHNRFQPDTFEALSHRIVQRVTGISD
ncbi:hypothetical protein NMY22_g1691 [Coprinellus aureogranulatus]|nr:hypothetical protein NMY22_g1691 [Coprinellus aureogranulatus]